MFQFTINIGWVDIINLVIAFQLLLFSLFLFLRKKKLQSNFLLGILLISQAVGVAASFIDNNENNFDNSFRKLVYAVYLFMVLWGPTFYLYIKAAAYKDFNLKNNLIHFFPFAIVFILLFTDFFGLYGNSLSMFNQYSIFLNIFIRIQVLFYIILSIRLYNLIRNKLKESFSSISKTNFSWIRFLVIGFITAYILSMPLVIYRYIIMNSNPSIELGILLPYFTFFNIIFIKAWHKPEIFAGVEENPKYKYSKLKTDEAEKWIDKLNKYMPFNKPYLNPDLSLNQLAEDMGIHPRILSQIINEHFSQNFFDYINKLRIEESKIYLGDPSCKKTIQEIFYEVGFNSKSAFNIAFKKNVGSTPTEYRKQINKSSVVTE